MKLHPVNKHIYIYSPSGAVRDKAAFNRGIQRLQTLGHEVEVDKAALASQPDKFGKLLLTLREGDSELVAIEKVYGWDEKQLAQQWRAYVIGRK